MKASRSGFTTATPPTTTFAWKSPSSTPCTPLALGAPLAEVLNGSIEDIGDSCQRSEAFAMKLPHHELALLELEYIDPVEKRPAHSLFCLARAGGVHALISIDYWPEDSKTALAAWEDVLGSLRLGDYMEHPFFGPREDG